MCILAAEIVMFVYGLIGLISGKLTVSKNLRVAGPPARITGAIFALPLPLAFGLGLVLGMLIGVNILPSDILNYSWILELILMLACLGGGYAYANANKGTTSVLHPTPPSEPPAIPPVQ